MGPHYFFFKWHSRCVCLRLYQYSDSPLDVDPLLRIGLLFFKKIIFPKSIYFWIGASMW